MSQLTGETRSGRTYADGKRMSTKKACKQLESCMECSPKLGLEPMCYDCRFAVRELLRLAEMVGIYFNSNRPHTLLREELHTVYEGKADPPLPNDT